MKVLLFQLDGKIPNIALMRIAAHWRSSGADVELRQAGNFPAVEPHLGDEFDTVYASAIFERTRNLVERTKEAWGRFKVFCGGTGSGDTVTLEELGVGLRQDYSIYPGFQQSIGFTQRGCRLKCGFCVVPRKEGAVRSEQGIYDIWRGDPWPRELLLLDNDFFGQPDWRRHIQEIRDGGFKVSFNQGINARCLTEEAAEPIE